MPPADARHELWLVRHGETEWARLGQAHRADRHPADRDRARPGAGPRAPARRPPLRARADQPACRARPTRPRWRASATSSGTTRTCGNGTTARSRAGRPPRSATTIPGWTIWSGPWPDGETIDARRRPAPTASSRRARAAARRRPCLCARTPAARPRRSLARPAADVGRAVRAWRRRPCRSSAGSTSAAVIETLERGVRTFPMTHSAPALSAPSEMRTACSRNPRP